MWVLLHRDAYFSLILKVLSRESAVNGSFLVSSEFSVLSAVRLGKCMGAIKGGNICSINKEERDLFGIIKF